MTIYGAKELAAAFRTVRGNTIKVIEELPEERFGFVAAPGMRPLGSLISHIAFAPTLYVELHKLHRITTLQGFDFGAYMVRGQAFESQPRSKAQLLDFLGSDGVAIASWMETLDDAFLGQTFTDVMGQHPKTRLESLMSIKEHEMHHRAQLMLIQRMLGGTPFMTRDRQARVAARAAAAAAATAATKA